jgi:hypothetical protein
MRYWLDTEFIETGKTIDLLSIGMVCEDGRTLYAVSLDADLSKANDWVKANVLPQLGEKVAIVDYMQNSAIAEYVKEFCDPEKYGKPEFWGYYADYDWVVFCWLFRQR